MILHAPRRRPPYAGSPPHLRLLYVIVPFVLLAAFAVGYRFSADRLREPVSQFRGEAPNLWPQPDSTPWQSVRLVSGDAYYDRNGAEDAEADARAGRYVVFNFHPGLHPAWTSECDEVWRDIYRVEVREPASAYLDETVDAYLTAYADAMRPHLQQRFGPDIEQRVERQAIALYAQRHPEAARDLVRDDVPALPLRPSPPAPPQVD